VRNLYSSAVDWAYKTSSICTKGDRFVAVKVPGNREDGDNYIIISFPIYCVGDQIKADETGRAGQVARRHRRAMQTQFKSDNLNSI